MRFNREKWLFIIQFFFSLIIITFCIHQIRVDKLNIATYWGGISSTLGYWLPSPLEHD